MYCLEYMTTEQLDKLISKCEATYLQREWLLPDALDFPGQTEESSYYGHTSYKEDFKEVIF